MAVTTISAIEQAIRTRLLTFNGNALRTALGTATGAGSTGKLYLDQPPDTVTHPYGVLRFVDLPVMGVDGGAMMKGTCEVILYGRPRAQAAALKAAGQLVLDAWQDFRDTTAGSASCLIAHDASSFALVPYTDPNDRELVACRILLPFMVTPGFLSP
jgi:hypothetical protein